MDSNERKKVMADMYRSGMTLREIGVRFGISRQRVQWLIARVGVGGEDGGYSTRRVAAYGFSSIAELKEVEDNFPGCVLRYRQQRVNARVRGVEWGFTLKTWIAAWGDQWSQRGIGGEALVMCRRNDVGAYAPGNVYIASCGQNSIDYQEVKKRRGVDGGQ